VIAAAALAAAAAVLVLASLPPRRLALAAAPDGTVAGILHIHTNRSDGLGTTDDVAAAAARAGLKFVVFTDHGDATRTPDPPTYRSGVLCLDGVEISTSGGHYVAIGMPASPYPLAGEARDVVDDVRRLGGFGIVAHPDSPKRELRWRDWSLPVDGVELLNPDTGWRVWAQEAAGKSSADAPDRWRARGRLTAALVAYPFRSPETIASLMLLGTAAVEHWAELAAGRRVVAIAGIDAHARIDWQGDGADPSRALALPGYEPSFETLSVHITPDGPFTGSAQADAAGLLRAIRNGHLYAAVDGFATPPSFEFSATNDRGTVHEGDVLTTGGPVTLRVRSNAPPSFTATVWNGATVMSADHHEPAFTLTAPAGPGVYRVEIRAPGKAHAASWLRSNPIYVRPPEEPPPTPARPAAANVQPIFSGDVAGWRVEHDAASLADVEAAPKENGGDLRFRYGLAGGAKGGQVAALAFDAPYAFDTYDRLTVTMRADRPMRVSIQLRAATASQDRWQRSVYLDATDRQQTVFFDDFTPVGATYSVAPDLARIRSVLFVVDVTNTKPGASGRIWVRDALLGR